MKAEVPIMVKNITNKMTSSDDNCNKVLNSDTTYEFNNNSFIVESVFKEGKSETLGCVLLRLISQHK